MLSLSFPQGMYLTVPPSALPLLGGLLSQPGRTSQKVLGRSHKIGLFSSPHHQTILPLPLTSDPLPHNDSYWLSTGWWYLDLTRAFLSDMSKKTVCCSCVCRGLEACRPCFLTSYVSFSLFSRSIQELDFVWWWALHFFGPLLGFLYFLQCCTVIPAVIT